MSRRGLLVLGMSVLLGMVGTTMLLDSEPNLNSTNLIRLHVIANSDSIEDQALKRKVRDRLIERLGPNFAEAKSLDDARSLIRENEEQIKELAEEEISSWGKKYDVAINYGNFQFPTKTYGGFILPSGEYEALRVVIGEGNGQNWWCVLFPPLCFVDISRSLAKDEPATPVMQGINSEPERPSKVKVKFKILDLFQFFTKKEPESPVVTSEKNVI